MNRFEVEVPAEASWLDEPPELSTVNLEQRASDQLMAVAREQAVADSRARPRYNKSRELTIAMRKCHFIERMFIRAMEASAYDVPTACNIMRDTGFEQMSMKLGFTLQKRPRVQHALELSLAAGLKRRGVTRDRVLADTARIRDYGMQTVPEVRHGKFTGRNEMRAPDIALNALDKLGKHTKAWGDENSNRVTIGIQVIDYTETRGQKKDEDGRILEAKIIDAPADNGETGPV